MIRWVAVAALCCIIPLKVWADGAALEDVARQNILESREVSLSEGVHIINIPIRHEPPFFFFKMLSPVFGCQETSRDDVDVLLATRAKDECFAPSLSGVIFSCNSAFREAGRRFHCNFVRGRGSAIFDYDSCNEGSFDITSVCGHRRDISAQLPLAGRFRVSQRSFSYPPQQSSREKQKRREQGDWIIPDKPYVATYPTPNDTGESGARILCLLFGGFFLCCAFGLRAQNNEFLAGGSFLLSLLLGVVALAMP